jgi:hypothetical protein
MASEKPILFSGPMVRAILAGTKTQTRRICQGQRELSNEHDFQIDRCPYGTGRMWVREAWRVHGGAEYEYMRDPGSLMFRADMEERFDCNDYRWRPSIFMPRWASRITLEITEVRVQRLQEITEVDAKAEGVSRSAKFSAREEFSMLWESINGKRAPWASNPWVWCLTFKQEARDGQ